MRGGSRRKRIPALLACLLLAGIFAPIAVLGQASTSSQQNQLAALLSAAESSQSYAHGIVNTAVSDGLSVGSAQSQLSQGDSFLATAQADAQAGSNMVAGLQAAEAAMSDYSGAAVSASLALSNAGLTATADYNAALSAEEEVNVTLGVVASIAAQVCGSADATTSGAQAYSHACAQVNANVTSARASLSQAASLLVGSGGHVAASAQVVQAQLLVARARVFVQACGSLLLTISSYSYQQRGQAYVTSVVNPLYAGANATIKAEDSAVAELNAYQESWTTYTRSQASGAYNMTSSASALQGAIAQVNGSGSSSILGKAQSAELQVTNEMVALLNIAAISALPGVVSDIHACANAAQTYDSSLGAAQSWNSAYMQTGILAFRAYASSGSSHAASVASDGSAYLSACNTVIGDLSGLLAIPGVQVIYSALVGLQLSPTVDNANAALAQELGAVQTVETRINVLNSTVSADETAVLVGSNLLASAASVSSAGGAYLNATVEAALAEVYTRAETTDLSAQAFVAAAQACLQTSIGTYATAVSSLAFLEGPLSTQTWASANAGVNATLTLHSDSVVRATEVGLGQTYLSQALRSFTNQNVTGGVNALAQAILEFQAASSVSA